MPNLWSIYNPYPFPHSDHFTWYYTCVTPLKDWDCWGRSFYFYLTVSGDSFWTSPLKIAYSYVHKYTKTFIHKYTFSLSLAYLCFFFLQIFIPHAFIIIYSPNTSKLHETKSMKDYIFLSYIEFPWSYNKVFIPSDSKIQLLKNNHLYHSWETAGVCLLLFMSSILPPFYYWYLGKTSCYKLTISVNSSQTESFS